ncbi:hypothetical protein GAYE_SCF16G3704 [Galdieria yellowstonensis]|uniref:glutamate-5-semialdehyde dehydrogenase n=1 Tax=Galdieria yellowstonensis TaxID=3028027 RepID=A0AAV9IE94_9RHOD|nr:hypothetical protein GAYE_SCF16G3704 [Galdieria yellowstonensis]
METLNHHHKVEASIEAVAIKARKAALSFQSCSTKKKNEALQVMKEKILSSKNEILEANQKDLKAAQEQNLETPLLKRLDLSSSGKLESLLQGISAVQNLEDPVGKVTLATELDHGLELYRVSCPLGVLCIIFESRPDAAVQISSLAIKSCNAVILKGGKEAERTNRALVDCIRNALESVQLSPDVVQLVSTREEIKSLLALEQYIDMVIPRGSNSLVRYIKENTKIPVMGHADGICAVYVDKDAEEQKAIDIVLDSKTQYPAVCNATETLLIHRQLLSSVFPKIATALSERGVVMKCDEESRKALPEGVKAEAAQESDYSTEFLNFTIAIKTVGDVHEAIEHINSHGSGHTDCIVTEDKVARDLFFALVDSAGVYHNASTRFADGFRYGFGAEVGVSTNKIHARGPVGLEGLLIYKYRLYGNGHTVAPYAKGEKELTHKPIMPQYRPNWEQTWKDQ